MTPIRTVPRASEKVGFDRGQAVVAALLFAMIVLNYLDRQVLSVVAPVLRKELGLSQIEYASAVNAFLLAYGVMYAGSGLVHDRTGARRGLAIFVGLWSLACALHAAVRGLATLAAFRFFLGLTEPGGWTGAVKTVAERFTPAQRGLVTGIFTSGAGIGALIAPPMIVALTLRYGWHSAFLVCGIAGLAWVPLWLLATRAAPGTRTAAAPQSGAWPALKNRGVLAYVITRLFGDSSGYFFLFWLPEYLVSSKNFTFAMVGALGWIPFCLMDLGALAGGYASGRLIQAGRPPLFSRKALMTTAALLVAAGTLFQNSSGVWLIVLSLSLCTFGVGIWSSNLHSVPADGFEPGVVATVHGLAGSAGAVGGILFNTLVGYFSAQGKYLSAFLLLAMLQPLGVAALWLWLPDKDRPTARR